MRNLAKTLNDAADDIVSDAQYPMYTAAEVLTDFDTAAADVIAAATELRLPDAHPLMVAINRLRAARTRFAQN